MALNLSSPFAISSRVANTQSNILQTVSTEEYLQDHHVSEKVFVIVSVDYLVSIQFVSEEIWNE